GVHADGRDPAGERVVAPERGRDVGPLRAEGLPGVPGRALVVEGDAAEGLQPAHVDRAHRDGVDAGAQGRGQGGGEVAQRVDVGLCGLEVAGVEDAVVVGVELEVVDAVSRPRGVDLAEDRRVGGAGDAVGGDVAGVAQPDVGQGGGADVVGERGLELDVVHADDQLAAVVDGGDPQADGLAGERAKVGREVQRLDRG